MSKEKLKFKISGKNVVYEGKPETRVKDLMDILAKMGVSEEIVIPTFRENIKDEGKYTNEQIKDLFKNAVQLRLKKKGKPADKVGLSKSSPATDESEKPQKITFNYKGKAFSYEGLPSGKQNALIQLLAKQEDITPDAAVEAFRQNIKDDGDYTDEQIWGMVTERIQSRQTQNGIVKESELPLPTSDENVSSGYGAIDELVGMSSKEKEDLNNFIKQVLQEPPSDVAALISNNPHLGGENADGDHHVTSRIAGKIPVYCQENDTSTKKLVHITPDITFSEFNGIIEKKFGYKVSLSFMEGEDMIILDDDDVLSMFLEMQADGKKLNLIVSKYIQRVGSEIHCKQMPLSSTTTFSLNTEPEFSNGELCIQNVSTFTGHTLAVYCCSFSSDGERFVTCSRDRSVRVWNTIDGKNAVMKGGHNGYVLSCNFSPKGNLVVSSADDRTIKLWSTKTNSKTSTLKGHEDKVYCVQFNPTGEYVVSGSCDNTVRVWRVDSCSKVATLKGHTLAVFSCGFSNTGTGKYVVSGSDDHLVKIWDWEERKEVRTLVGHVGTVWSVKFSNNDAYIISTSMDHELKLWVANTGACIRTLAAHKAPIHHAIFSEDDKYIFSCARDCVIKAWRVDNGEHVATVTGHLNTVYHIDIKGNKMLTASLDNTLKLWTITEKR
ncbi:unnamed protein product [Phytomonas sp. EM1]|nr:unnamed protein product [Phytomonas sp. EM1]|eukprot:CCW61144.1 unnamed protein product [Phytomonas sp. isolate EM1]